MTELIHVCVAWPYANGDLHLGHIAGTFLPADIFARYHRLRGNDVLFVSGSDTHGTPITIAADGAGLSPRALVQRQHRRFLDTLVGLHISFDLFTHTDTQNHHRVAQDLFLKLYENGHIYPQTQRLLFCESEHRFLADRYVTGTCPHCGYGDARGDQCDECGQILDGIDLIDPVSITDGKRPVVRETTHLFLNLPAFTDALLAYFDAHSDHWRSNALNFSRAYVASGLRGRPITRDLSWGIDVPLAGWESKKLYIWFENVIGYLSASIEWAHKQGTPDAWRRWLFGGDSRSYYFVGKDNIPFHTIIWPAQLIGATDLYGSTSKDALNLPYDVPASEYLTFKERQFSKSRNWAVWAPDLLERFESDTIRFVTASLLPEQRDADFTWGEFVRRNNDELVATWGNLTYRVLSYAYKQWGVVPYPGPQRAADRQLLNELNAGFKTVGELIESVKLRFALQEALRLARTVNRYLEASPWHSVLRTDREAAATTVFTALQAINGLKILFAPFLPDTSEALHQLSGCSGTLFGRQLVETQQDDTGEYPVLTYDARSATGSWEPDELPAGQPLREPAPLFRKLNTAVDLTH